MPPTQMWSHDSVPGQLKIVYVSQEKRSTTQDPHERIVTNPPAWWSQDRGQRTSIPNLCFHSLSIYVYWSRSELDTNGWLWLEVKFVTSKTREHYMCKNHRMSNMRAPHLTIARTVTGSDMVKDQYVVYTFKDTGQRTICQHRNHQWGQPMTRSVPTSSLASEAHLEKIIVVTAVCHGVERWSCKSAAEVETLLRGRDVSELECKNTFCYGVDIILAMGSLVTVFVWWRTRGIFKCT